MNSEEVAAVAKANPAWAELWGLTPNVQLLTHAYCESWDAGRLAGLRESESSGGDPSKVSQVCFEIPWTPVYKGNKIKVAKRGGRFGIARDFDGTTKMHAKCLVTNALIAISDGERSGLPWDAPFKAEVVFFSQAPKNLSAWKREASFGGVNFDPLDETTLYCLNGKDMDNLEKHLWDSLEKVFFKNDSMLVSKTVSKVWAPENRLRVRLTKLCQATAKSWKAGQ